MWKDGKKLKISMENHSLDVPYAETFRVMEYWDVITTSPD